MSTPVKWGHEFLVNSTTGNDQSDADIMALADGRFVAAWTDASQTGGDTSSWAVRAQVFNANGSQSGAEFLVNTTTLNYQFQPSITALADGRFVVVWSDGSRHSNAPGNDVRAQLFNADGSPSGAEFVVNTTLAFHQDAPTITTLADGGFVVAFADQSASGADTSSYAIRAQIFNAVGSTRGSEFLVNTNTSNAQFEPEITTLADGRFVVAWTDNSQSGSDNFAIRAQVFNADGSQSGTEFLVNTTTASYQVVPSITALTDGGFVVTWTDWSQSGADTSYCGVLAQVFNADGVRSGTEFLVNTTTENFQQTPKTAALADGGFVVAWTDNLLRGANIRAQLFNADGSRSGTEFQASTHSARLYIESIVALADGRFVVAWTDYSQTGDDTSGAAIRAQIFDPREAAVNLAGSAVGDDFIGTAFGDTMSGKAGDDRLSGRAGNDLLTGDGGRDLLLGRLGTDTIAGGAGDDTLTGGFGTDTFQFGKGGDHDTVTDFRDGADVIDLTSFGFASFAAAASHFAAAGADILFTSGTNTLLIQGFVLPQLTADDLIL